MMCRTCARVNRSDVSGVAGRFQRRTIRWGSVVLRVGFPHLRLDLANRLLDLALDLLTGVAPGGADNIIGLALRLLRLSGESVFGTHMLDSFRELKGVRT